MKIVISERSDVDKLVEALNNFGESLVVTNDFTVSLVVRDGNIITVINTGGTVHVDRVKRVEVLISGLDYDDIMREYARWI